MVYYLTKRPAAPGSIPAGAASVKNFDKKIYIEKIRREAWAAVEYAEPLPLQLVKDYEMTPENADPDRSKLEKDAGRVLLKAGYKGRDVLEIVKSLNYEELTAIINA